MAAEVDKINTEMAATRSRWTLAWAWLAGLVVYGIAIYIANNDVQLWINDLAWTVAAAAATIAVFALPARSSRSAAVPG